MNVGLIDVDGHHFPNLALMRISAWHKAQGDYVEWHNDDMFHHYDRVYMSKVFSFSKDIPEPVNADEVIQGGTGYAIFTEGGVERFDKTKHTDLPEEIEKMFPDYSIYPEFEFAVSMTSRGCPRGCSFCHVGAKEGRCAVKVANVSDFWGGQKEIKVMDPNILAAREKEDLLRQYRDTGAELDFNQGLDIRLMTEGDLEIINQMRIKKIHFAWDNPKDDLEPRFRWYSQNAKKKPKGSYGMVYVLVNFNSTMEEDLHRIYTLRDLKYDPYVMVYNKASAPKEVRRLQRWCNNKIIFKSCKTFEEYR